MAEQTYFPSASTGIFGSYTVGAVSGGSNNESTDEKTASTYEYLPSINSGVFGSYTPNIIIKYISNNKLPDYLETSPKWKDGNGHKTPKITDKIKANPPAPPNSRGVTVLAEWEFKNTKNNKNVPKLYVCRGKLI